MITKTLYGRAFALTAFVLVLAAGILALTFSAMRALEERHAALRLEEQLLQANQHVKDFALTRRPTDADAADAALAAADSILRAGLDGREDTLHAALHRYSATFDSLRQVTRRRGFTEELGAEGRFRSSVHAVETIVRRAGKESLLVHMLSARRSEKDYIMRRRAEYIRKVHASVDTLVATSRQVGLSMATQGAIQDYILKYRRDFDRLVALLRQQDGLRHRLDVAGQTVGRQVDRIVRSQERQAEQRRLAALFVIAVACIGSVAGAVWLTRSVVRPITKLQRAAHAIVTGDTDVQVSVKGGGD